MRFDLLIKGGEVVDPGGGHAGLLDVAVSRGRVAAVDHDIPAEAAFEVVDATGRIVTPGLVDLHTHVFHKVTYWGIDPDPVASSSGVTTWNDAGSAGALTLPGLREFVVDRSRVRITAFLNISNIGLVGENYECANPAYLDVDLFRRLADRNRDLVAGVKVRMGTPTVGELGLEPLRLARRAAEECELPLMVHVAFGPPAIEDVLALMRPGDILTHCFTGLTMKIVDERGRLHECAKRAWDAGVVMDIGHGTGSFSYDTAEALMAAGRRPDVISTDLHQLSINGPAYDLPTCLSKFLHLGMSLPEVVRAATSRPAEVLGMQREVGTLGPGAVADVALFELLTGRFPLYDIWGEMREASRLLVNTLTIVGGRPLAPLPPAAPAPWAEDPIWPEAQKPFTDRQQELRDRGHTPAAMRAAARSPGATPRPA
ncbi:MAG TPA: amidohydrolase/deacetylase family metallohydrolase [Gaiellaceae bacterium]|jgi:dihydroorotase|nr:amidohydrolase/deacetylase family metallohydrolase [Gaiellaceae bacterium]